MPCNLLEFSKGGGCGCKIEPAKLGLILKSIKHSSDPRNLIDFRTSDDASVMDLGNGLLLIQTVDFFLPVVKDPYDFGRIAAANAISDVYAMGGKPLTALSILGWPLEKISLDDASLVLKGAQEICVQAGISISGGHSVDSAEPIFGLSVSGTIVSQNLKRNSTCLVGDKIYLTKPLGLGLLANAVKLDQISEDGYAQLLKYATQLNILGLELGAMPEITAMTDVTGFGLLGHLSEMLGKNLGANLNLIEIPVIEEAKVIASKMIYPNITTSNYNFIKDRTEGLNGLEFLWLCDPQTSGGLMFTCSKEINRPGVCKIGEVNASGKMILI
ncbi:MAG: selenide, water dikinase SelD [Bacteroidia bacterium]|nr:selenide, water dikinase SelD [Bacteroidia bacterium]